MRECLRDFDLFEVSDTLWVKPTTEDSHSPPVVDGTYHDGVIVSFGKNVDRCAHPTGGSVL
jgi:hypothetical protein